MKTLEYKNRKAFSVSIEKLLIIGIALVAVAAVAAFGGDLVGTATVVDSLELSKQTLYSDQEFVSVTVKNGGTTPVDHLHAFVLIKSTTDCSIGSTKALIATSATVDHVGIDLSPGASVTISGSLNSLDATKTINSDGDYPNADITAISCGNTGTNAIDDRTEYIIQVDGVGEGDATISATSTVRSR